MNKTLLIIGVVVVGGLVVAFASAPDDDALQITPAPSNGPSISEDDGEESRVGNVVNNQDGNEFSLNVGIDEGDLAADFTLQSFDGESVTLSSLRGAPVLIDFWAGWCPFCINELPELEKAHQQFGDDLVVLGIHRTSTESVETGRAFANEHGVTYTLLKDSDGSVYSFYSGGRNFMPVSYFIDRNGVIYDRVLGPKSAEQIQLKIGALLAQ